MRERVALFSDTVPLVPFLHAMLRAALAGVECPRHPMLSSDERATLNARGTNRATL